MSYDMNWGIRDLRVYIEECEGSCHLIEKELKGDFENPDGEIWVFKNDLGEDNITKCENGIKILGGLSKLAGNNKLTKTFTGLRPHHKVLISFNVYLTGTWSGKVIKANIDG